MSLENLKPIVQELGKVSSTIKQLQAVEKKLKAQVAEALADQGTKQFGSYQVTVKTMAGRKTLDKKLLEQAGIDLEPYYKVGAPYTTTTIKQVDVV